MSRACAFGRSFSRARRFLFVRVECRWAIGICDLTDEHPRLVSSTQPCLGTLIVSAIVSRSHIKTQSRPTVSISPLGKRSIPQSTGLGELQTLNNPSHLRPLAARNWTAYSTA